MSERMIQTSGIDLCTESFGEPTDPPVLLVMGIGASMLWWDDAFCQLLAGGHRFAIRYDHRDTGRSVTYPHGQPGYTGADLVADAAAVLDAYELESAHVVGTSAGGALAQVLALHHPDRIRTLVLISTSPAVATEPGLPPSTDDFRRFVSTATLDWSDATSVEEYLVEHSRVLAGPERPFDEAGVRDLVRRDRERARDFAALQNHDAIPEDEREHPPLSTITTPTLVIHGTADPMFPVEHGEALAGAIPDAQLLRLEGSGHGMTPADAAPVATAILRHTAASAPPDG